MKIYLDIIKSYLYLAFEFRKGVSKAKVTKPEIFPEGRSVGFNLQILSLYGRKKEYFVRQHSLNPQLTE